VTTSGGRQRASFSGYYDRPLNTLLFRWIDIRKVGVIRRAFADLPPEARIVDLGCGAGTILARVARTGDLAVAADVDLSLLGRAAGRGTRALRLDFDTTLPVADESFHGALIIDALEHAVSPHRILDELYRLLRPRGVLVVFTPPYDSLTWVAAEGLHNLVTRRTSDHISPFTRESLAWAMTRRFAEVRIGRVNLGLSMYAVAVK
jgi:2-polyprenyl-3-methyl-5-hydroxy-6-metoxy-1,4-benzoquinol methylase